MSKLCPICNANEAAVFRHGSRVPDDWTYGPCLDCGVIQSLMDNGVYKLHSVATLTDCGRWARELVGKGALLHGAPGVGKTHLAVALMREDLLQRKQAHFVTVPNMIQRLKSSFDRNTAFTEAELMEFYSTVPNLYLDDIGVENQTSFVKTVLYTIIDRRNGEQLRTVITSNLNILELEELCGQRLVSRILQMCEPIELTGRDRRLQ